MKVIVILLLASLALVPSSLEAFAQVVETKGENYDLVENSITGEAIYQSYPDRIMNGVWENYVLTNTADKVIFNTNSVGTFIFDKNSCSYSIYENGYDGANVIPSVSAVATYLNSTVWSNMPVNDEACTVTVESYEDGISLKSSKILTGIENVFIPISSEEFYADPSLSSEFTLESSTFLGFNGEVITVSGYFNGDTFSIMVTEFTQEIDLNVFSGFKETFMVGNVGEQELGVSQTIHTGSEIEIAGQVIDIQALNGQSFDRQYIIDNKAEILKISNDLNYDFDVGIDSLESVNIIFEDNEYKVNLDYANGDDGIPFIGYLKIDPTITTTGSGTFDITPLHNHIISSGTIDGSALSGAQVSALQVDITALNQYHTLSGTTLVVSYTVATAPQPPTSLTTTAGIPIVTSWTAPIDDGDSSIIGYKVFRTLNSFSHVDLPNSSGSDSQIDMADNELLIHGYPISDSSTNSISITATGGSYVNGTIKTAIQDPDLTYASTLLPDTTDPFSVGGWVKLDTPVTTTCSSTAPQTCESFLTVNDVEFNVGSTTADVTAKSVSYSSQGAVGGISCTVGALACNNNFNDNVQTVGFYPASNTYNMPYMVSAGASVHVKSEYHGYQYGGGGYSRGLATQQAYNSVTGEYFCISGAHNGNPVTANGACSVATACNGSPWGCPSYQMNDSTVTVPIAFDSISTNGQITIQYSGSLSRYWDINIPAFTSPTSSSSVIVSATGLPDTTTEPRHIVFTRGASNDWTIYSQGSSVATATSSTSLGSNVGLDYITNVDGTLDEFFINSDTLTSTEIDNIYDRGVAPTLIDSPTLATSSDSSVTGGTTYYYSTQAVNSVGYSNFATPFVSGLAGTPPDPPTSISATIANTATAPLDVVVTWSNPADVGTGTLSNFEIFRDGVSQGQVGLVNTFANTVPSTGTFAFTVKAISDHGTSVSSTADSITTPSLPSQPTLTVTVLSDTSMQLDWTASNENSSTLQGYKIEYSLDNSVWANLVSNTGNVALISTPTSLNVDDQYYWRVSGINGVGAGTASATQNAWTLLSAPTNLVATAMAIDQIDLAWTGISGISSYTIEYESPTGNGFTTLASGVSSGDTTYTSGSLTTGTQYNYRIVGVSTNSGSNSVASNEDSANTFGILPAPVLDLLTSVTVNPASVQLDFTASAGSPLATGYKIERNLGSGWIAVNTDTGSTSTTYLDTATTSMNEPAYRVSAINTYGVSPTSNELTLTAVSSGGSGGGSGGGGGSSKKIVTAIDELLNISILGNTHVMSNGEFLTGKIPISWDSGENLRISAVDYDDSILDSIQFNMEDTAPIILQGSGNSFSSDDITYTISTPTQICNALTSDPSKKITTNCLQEKLYELPITVTATSVGDNISQTTLITIDTRSGFGGDTLALLSIFIMVVIAGIGIIKLARKSSGGKRNHSTNGHKKTPQTPKKPRKSIK